MNKKMHSPATWYPHVTVATIIEDDGRFLMVYEKTDAGERYNQPAGHLEENESLIEAAVRETKEETAYDVAVDGFLRLNQYTSPANGVTYIRITFIATILQHDPASALDKDIIEAKWLTKDFLENNQDKLRSPVVLSDIEFYLSSPALPLEYLTRINPSLITP